MALPGIISFSPGYILSGFSIEFNCTNSSTVVLYFFAKFHNVSFLLTILTVTFFLWFMDIVTTGGPKQKEKKIEIRPKAKPNRVKHLNNAQNNTNNKK